MERDVIIPLLRNYYRYIQQRESLQEQIDNLMTRATKITPNFDPEKVGSVPFSNPKPSKVELYAVKIVSAQKKIEQLDMLISEGEKLFKVLRPHHKYLVKCILCNGMPPEEFSKREGIKPQTVKANLEKIYKKLEEIE